MSRTAWTGACLAGVFAVAAYELWAALNGLPGDTLSELAWNHMHPMLAFVVGVVVGHLFWQRRR